MHPEANHTSVAAGGAPVVLSPGSINTNSVTINPDNSNPQTDPNALHVSANESQQLPSAQQTTATPDSNSPKTITPADFKEFDKYKDAQNSLYVELAPGTGVKAEAGKQVTVNYRGWLTDGREFDESYASGKPFTFVPGEHKVILGWEEGILGLKVGGKRLLIVPPAVGYGAQGKDPVPPNAVLVFEIELVGVQ